MKLLLLDIENVLGGTQREIINLANGLNGKMVNGEILDVSIACSTESPLRTLADEAEIPCVTSKYLNTVSTSAALYLRCLLRSAEFKKKSKHAFVHTFTSATSLLPLQARKLLRAQFFCVHTSRSQLLPVQTELKAHFKADALIATCKSIADFYKILGYEPNRLFVAKSGHISQAVNRSIPNQETRHFSFTLVGALLPHRGYDVLFAAMAEMLKMKDLPEWEVRVFGSGEMLAECIAKAEELGIISKLCFFTSFEPNAIFEQSNALIAPSTAGEGGGSAVKEAWDHSLPVIVSDLPCHMELVESEVNGLIVPAGDASVLAQNMMRMLKNPQLCAKLGNNGKERLSLFTVASTVQVYCDVYGKLSQGYIPVNTKK